ncbi:MAG: type II secretion system F family protein [Bryobacteraceae bacterium]
MPVVAIFLFVVIFALTMLAVSFGLKFFDTRRKAQMTAMLHTATGEPMVVMENLLKEIRAESPSGFRAVLASLHFTRRAQEQIQQAGLNWSSTRLLASMAVTGMLGMVLGTMLPFLVNGPITAVTAGLACSTLPYLYVRHKRQKRLDTLEEQLPEALDFLSRSMRAGHAFSISLEMVGEEISDPLGQEFRALFNEQNLGAPLDVALRNFGLRVPLLDVRFFTSSVLLQKQTGGNLSEILTRLAYVIRERFRLKGQVRAASAHGRLTASILTLLPVGTMLGLLVVAPGYLQSMAADSDGKWMIGGAIVAQILGNFFIKKIINIKV